nr:hypothetical protein [Desulfobulbaceae bacterium]
MIVELIDYFRDRLKTVIKVCYGVLAALVVIDAIPTIVDKHHAHTWIEHIPGFWAVFGFIACVIIIILSKWFGHQGIMTREDYYDD